MMSNPTPAESPQRDSWLAVFLAFLRLGLTSFGGPVAHLGYFRNEFVERRKWLDEAAYTDIIALCQFLPGPASSQVGITIGILRAGLPGAFAAWLGFSGPSALAMIAFGYGVAQLGDITQAPWLHGLKIVAVAVVAQAVWSMAVAAALLALALPNAVGQIGAIIVGALIGWRLLPAETKAAHSEIAIRIAKPLAIAAMIAFFVLLGGLPLLTAATQSHGVALVDSFYRTGSLVFGGGHVVLPLLQKEVVPPGWIGNDAFLAGYGAAQAVPGPLFTFSAYLGTVMQPGPNGWLGGLICLAAIYLPSFLLLIGVLPYWDALRRRAGVQSALKGVNAAVVGLLLAALYTPVWTSAILNPADFGIGIAAFLLLVFWRVPPWIVVLLGAASAEAFGRFL
jgi:chromate transporter